MPFFYCTCALGTKGNGTYCISKLKCALFEVTFFWLTKHWWTEFKKCFAAPLQGHQKVIVGEYLAWNRSHQFSWPRDESVSRLKLTNCTYYFSNSPLVLSYYRTGSGLHDWLKAFNKQMARGIPNVQLVTIPKPRAGNRTRGIFSFYFALFGRIIQFFIGRHTLFQLHCYLC